MAIAGLDLVWLVPALTGLAFVLALFLGRWQPGKGGPLTFLLVAAAGALGVWTAVKVWGSPFHGAEAFVQQVEWFTAGELAVNVGIYVDNLTALMLFVVGILTTLILLYSLAYMRHDHEENWETWHDRDTRPRYYAEMALFITGMFGFVLSSNLLEAFIFWEIMGLCSYLLIGFWYTRPSAAKAATKAFLVTRVGDLFFFAGIAILFVTFGTLDFEALFAADLAAVNQTYLTVAMACLFIGAVGKSAQVPLHVWLPDAMEGPTTVSALIHAATMVKAGVYLVARMYPLFVQVPVVLLAVAIVGGVTAFVAASMALVNNDLKKVFAFSTVSQLGYMFLALGVGAIALTGYSMGLFHLLNHAFFKALLFLAAGSVGHALHTYDMRKLGGLHRHMPWTSITMLVAGFSLAGIAPFGGFWSKDEVLASVREAALEAGHVAGLPAWAPTAILALYALGVLVALMTAFYMFRAWFMTFRGYYRGDHDEDHIHESPGSMVLVLLVLAVFAIAGGSFLFLGQGLPHFLENPAAVATGGEVHAPTIVGILSSPLTWLSLAAAGLGVVYAWLRYRPAVVHERIFLDGTTEGVVDFLYNRWYWSELYAWLADRLVVGLARGLRWFDAYVIDGIVDGLGDVNQRSGEGLRRWTTGNVSDYALTVVAGLVLLIILVVEGPLVLRYLEGLNLLQGGI